MTKFNDKHHTVKVFVLFLLVLPSMQLTVQEKIVNKYYNLIKIPGDYMDKEYREDNNNFANDLNAIPTYNTNHQYGVHTGWLHHTYPNEIFNLPSNVEKAKNTIEKLLWKGLSKLKDSILKLLNTIKADSSKTERQKLRIMENYIVAMKQVINSYNDYYIQVCNTFELGSDIINKPKDNEYGPETNFWIHFRGYLTCFHQKRLGPEVGGQKIWCM